MQVRWPILTRAATYVGYVGNSTGGETIQTLNQVDVAIIGAGLVGLATGLALVSRFPNLSLAVLEKEAAVARHQSGHNSGVIHSGIYYKPGSLKARLCAEGGRALVRFCQQHAIAHEICGKVIVATNDEEVSRLAGLFRRGEENGLTGLRLLDGSEIADFEPHARGLAGIFIPGTGIVDYARVAEKYAELITARGGAICLSHEVLNIRADGAGSVIETTRGAIAARLILNCAGLQSDHISRMAGAKLDLTIVPFRGEYYDLVPERRGLVRHLLYPVPDPNFPFLGVHFTRGVSGRVEAGPNAVLALKREGYSKSSFQVSDVANYCRFPGFWRMARRHWRTSLGEYHRSWSKRAFVRALQRLVPEITEQDLVAGGAGVRAQALGRDGGLLDDFHFVFSDRMVQVCNVPSPAATASLAIGRCIADRVVEHYGTLVPKLTA